MKKLNDLRKLDLEVYKTQNYMGHMHSRLKKIETDLDAYFVKFLKNLKKRKAEIETEEETIKEK